MDGVDAAGVASDPGNGIGTGFHIMASHTLKMEVVAPIPSPIVTMAVTAKPGDWRSTRIP